MDLRTDYPYWLLRHGIIRSYPSLDHHVTTDIAIMGGGISGALAAWYLVHAGFSVIVVDRRHIAMGSTAASTSLLQYEIDIPLHDLIKKVGEKKAVRSYILCRDAIRTLRGIADKLEVKDLLTIKPSLQFASYLKHIRPLQKELILRKKAGISIGWLDEKEIQEKYGFSGHGGILSEDGADCDAYQLTHSLLQKCAAWGLKVFDHTEIIKIRHEKKGVELCTGDGKKIKARKLIIACGYESQRYIPKKVQELKSTFVIVSEPHQQNKLWYKNSLIWETKTPYLYLRTTTDNRIIVGGKDISSSDPVLRDRLLPAKSKSLERSFAQLFPVIPFRTDFRWAGSFGHTKDGLPYIGIIRQRPHTHFALGLGGNGIIFSVIAAEIVCDILKGKKNEDAEIFSFDR
ncbi:MAG: NAD(P)/FAD-dependent oxidoreductase [Chitinophagales bacterium]